MGAGFGRGPSFHVIFNDSASLFGDPHKNLLYKRNINLYKYLQKGGEGENKAFSVRVLHKSTKTLFHIPQSNIQHGVTESRVGAAGSTSQPAAASGPDVSGASPSP